MKYIDAEKLKAKLRRQKHELELSIQSQGDYGQSCQIVAYENILSLINSLQQEQPEVDLEKEMDKYYGMYRDKTGKTYDVKDDEPCFDWKEDELSEHEMRMARHFYELGLKARKGEQEQQEVNLEEFTEKIICEGKIENE